MIASTRNPLYARTTDEQLRDLYRAAAGRRTDLYRQMDKPLLSADRLAEIERTMDTNERELFRLDDELRARGLPLPKTAGGKA